MTVSLKIPESKAPYSPPRRIWRKPCVKCPSAHYPPDPESEDMERMYKSGAITVWDATFQCAWRPGKMCKGLCDRLGITVSDLQGPIEFRFG